MKRNTMILIVVAWAVIILSFVAIKEYTLRTGDDVILRTAPVDPVDMFRGDYVVLRYEISTIDMSRMGQIGATFLVGDPVYVELTLDENNIATATHVTKIRPKQGKFILGEVTDAWGETLTIQYGIESYFVPQGTGRDLERATNMTVSIKLDDFGRAVIKNVMVDGRVIKLEDLRRPEVS